MQKWQNRIEKNTNMNTDCLFFSAYWAKQVPQPVERDVYF